MDKKFVTIRTANVMSDLIVAESFLRDAGIETHILDELINQMNPLYSNAFGGIRLQVNEADVFTAKEILIEGGFIIDVTKDALIEEVAKVNNVESEQVVCPYCGSDDVSKKRLSKTAFGFSVLLLGFQLPFYSKQLFCYDCRKDFRLKS